MTVGERLRAIRRQCKWTQQRLGDAIGRTQQEIYRWEKGQVRIAAEDLLLIAHALDISILAFFPGHKGTMLPRDVHLVLQDCARQAADVASAIQDVVCAVEEEETPHA